MNETVLIIKGDRYRTIAGAARHYSVSKKTIYAWIREGTMKVKLIGAQKFVIKK